MKELCSLLTCCSVYQHNKLPFIFQHRVTFQDFLCVCSSTMAANFSQVMVCEKSVHFATSMGPQDKLILMFSGGDSIYSE